LDITGGKGFDLSLGVVAIGFGFLTSVSKSLSDFVMDFAGEVRQTDSISSSLMRDDLD
jgi:hypothetical protein